MRNKRFWNCIVISGILFILLVSSVFAGNPATISEKYGIMRVNSNRYIIQNNVWGADTAQSVYIPDIDETAFNLSVSDHIQNDVASYPSIYKGAHWGTKSGGWESIPIYNLSEAFFSWNVSSYRPPGKYNVAAEIWFSPNLLTSSGYNNGGELMIWLDSHGGMVPAGAYVGTFNGFDVYYADLDWNYVAYVNTGLNSVDINITEFIEDSIDRGYLNENWYFHCLEAGFEICNGGLGLNSLNFSATITSVQPEPGPDPPPQTISGYNFLIVIGLVSIFTFIGIKIKKIK